MTDTVKLVAAALIGALIGLAAILLTPTTQPTRVPDPVGTEYTAWMDSYLPVVLNPDGA
jgi:hypothetical protein